MDVRPRGNPSPKVLVVGEAPGEQEVRAGVPFVGASGKELMKMLKEAGIAEEECRFTNLVNTRPPRNDIDEFFYSSKKKATDAGDAIWHWGRYCKPIILQGLAELETEIEQSQPNVILALGNSGLWATTGEQGIGKWRGSEMLSEKYNVKVVPTYHPASILRNWENRFIAVQDMRRTAREKEYPNVITPNYNFILSPNHSDALQCIADLQSRVSREPTKIAVDIETRNRQIACIGLAWSSLDAICIPIQSITGLNGSYWTQGEEIAIIWALYNLLTHPNAQVIGQNFTFDNQYFARNYGFVCNLVEDTMVAQHIAYPGLPKSLDFISSMYREHHLYWKDDGKTWDPRHTHELQLWNYNAVDSVATYESHGVLEQVLLHYNLTEQYREKLRTGRTAFGMMLRGVRSNQQAKLQLSSDLAQAIAIYRKWLMDIINYDVFGPKAVSPKKLMYLVYDIMKLPTKWKVYKGVRRRTADKEALREWVETAEPIFRPILKVIEDVRSMQVFKSSFADQELDYDDRFRCSFNVVGAHTMRWTSSEDAFNYGGNLQTIPKGDER